MLRSRLRHALARTPYFWRFRHLLDARFPGSSLYWNKRYEGGGTSGAGSYGRLASFKAAYLNNFVQEHDVRSVIEFGCGDGAQLGLAAYPKYIGLDVSPTAIKLCVSRFASDTTKSFFLYDGQCFADHHQIFSADLSLSLDVVYHLTEDDVYSRYMRDLFKAGSRFVIIYSSNHDQVISNTHVRHRHFTADIARWFSDFTLVKHTPQKYPSAVHGETDGSFADFYVFAKS